MGIQEFMYLVVIETQKTKHYLFASPIMRETRGASVLLDRLNRVETIKILENDFKGEYHVVYLGGGSGRVLFRDDGKATAFKKKLEQCYHEETASAKIAVEVVERESKESFAQWVARGVGETRKQKLGKVQAVPILAGRWIRPCTSCGQAPAEQMHEEHGKHYLCSACMKKRAEISPSQQNLYWNIKPGMRRKRTLAESKLREKYSPEFIFVTLAEKAGKSVLLPQDFDDIGECSRPTNYMGFIYADGNTMGDIVKRIGSEYSNDADAIKAYTAFSEITDLATREAAVEAVLEVVRPRDESNNTGYLPAEFLIAGGDDLMLIVPAQYALEVTLLFLEKYQSKSCVLQDQYTREGKLKRPFALGGLTSSAGIILAHTHYPASELMTLSADLMKLAKQKASDLGGKTCTLDFMVLNEAGTEPVKRRRKVEYRFSIGEQFVRTERPYTVSDARWLLSVIRGFKKTDVPRTKLKALYPILFQSPEVAMFHGQRLKERLKTSGALEKSPPLQTLIDQLGAFPFRMTSESGKESQHYTTPFSELIELYDFIHVDEPQDEDFQQEATDAATQTLPA